MAGGQIQITPEQVKGVATQFRQKSEQTAQMVAEMKRAVDALQQGWKGAAQTNFYAEYQSWDADMKKYVDLLQGIGEQLDHVADQFVNTDTTVVRRSGR